MILERKKQINWTLKDLLGFPGGSGVETPPANAGDTGSIPDPGRSRKVRSNQAHEPVLWSPEARVLRPLAATTGAPAPDSSHSTKGGATAARGPSDRSREGPALHSRRGACAGIYPREVDTCLHTDVHTRVHRPGSPWLTPAARGGCHVAQLA